MKGNQQNGEEEAREESDRHTSTPSPYRLSKARGNAGKAGKTQVLAHLVSFVSQEGGNPCLRERESARKEENGRRSEKERKSGRYTRPYA